MDIRIYRHFHLFKHIARVHACVHLHDGNARDLITFKDRSLYGGRTSSCGKKASVTVKTAVFWDIQDILREDLSVCCGNDKIRFKRLDLVVCFFCF